MQSQTPVDLLAEQCCGAVCLDLAAEIDHVLCNEFSVDVWKTLNPLDDRDFVILFTRLREKLERATTPIEADVVASALETLDVDWNSLTPAGRSRVADATNRAIRAASKSIVPRVEEVLLEDRVEMADRTRAAVKRRYRLDIIADISRTDQEIARRAAKSQGNFVTDEYGLRAERVEQTARNIVASGLDRGLGNAAIAAELEGAIPAQIIGRSRSYWNVIAGAFANRARTFTQLGAFDDAGITMYVFHAVLDRATTEQCRFLHGRQFSVGVARRTMAKSDRARNPLDLKHTEPWLRKGKDGDKTVLYTLDRRGNRRVVADVIRAAEGQADRVGEYALRVSERVLGSSGIPWPPLHGL